MTCECVTASILDEDHMIELLSNKNTVERKGNFNSYELLNNKGTLAFQDSTKQMYVAFNNLKIKRNLNNELMPNQEKFYLVFSTTLDVNGTKLKLLISSMPVAVIDHDGQEPQARAIITWHNAFGECRHKKMYVPDEVTWGQVNQSRVHTDSTYFIVIIMI